MTVGIAAICVHNEKPAIALCCDWQGTWGDFIKSDDVYKIRNDGPVWALIAGGPTQADELFSACIPAFRKFTTLPKDEQDFDLRIGNLLSDLRDVTVKHKKARVAHHIATKWSLTYEQFWNEGLKNLSPQNYAQIWNEIIRMDMGAELILTYADDTEPLLVRIGGDGGVVWEENYSVIGSGSSIALAILCQNEHDDNMPAMDCLARIYTAKVAAEKDPAVGRSTAISLSAQGGKSFDLTDEGWKYLKRKAGKIAPPPKVTFKESFFKEEPRD